jgi:hypothetical protein
MTEQRKEVEEGKKSGSLRNKVREWSCLLHVFFFHFTFYLFLVVFDLSVVLLALSA